MSPKSPAVPDYERCYKIAFKNNIEEVRGLVQREDKGMRYKIQRFCDKCDESFEGVRAKILEDSLFAIFFAKDPSKQRFHEKLVAQYIEGLPIVEEFRVLPNSALVIVEGSVKQQKEAQEEGLRSLTKTIDFQWRCQGKRFYASHKYTKEGGGAQENQYKDLRAFLEEANKSRESHTYFLAIADGDFYKGKNGHSGMTKIQSLKSLANNAKGVFALTIEELEGFLERLPE